MSTDDPFSAGSERTVIRPNPGGRRGGPTPPGAALQAHLGTGAITGASVADIRAFLAGHRVGAVLMAEQPRGSDSRRILAAATGVAGVRSGRVVVFQLPTGPTG